MSTEFNRYSLFLFSLIIVSCQLGSLDEIDFPEVVTDPNQIVSSITSVTIESTISGMRADNLVHQCGHVLFTQSIAVPRFDDETVVFIKPEGERGNGGFESTITGLTPDKSYYGRAYLILGDTTWGEEVSFRTKMLNAVLEFETFCIDRNERTATVMSTFTFSGIENEILLKSYGVTWASHSQPTIQNDPFIPEAGRAVRNETYEIESIIFPEGDTNFVRAYFVVGQDTTYGPERHFLVTNFWTQVADFTGGPDANAVAFSIGNKGYVVITKSTDNFYEFDPQGGVDANGYRGNWTLLTNSNLPGGGRKKAVSFSMNGKGYVGLGEVGGILQNNFYEFDPSTGDWKEMEEFPGQGRIEAAAFSLVRDGHSYGYVGLGHDGVIRADFYEFDPNGGDPDGDEKMGTWRPINDFGEGRRKVVEFTINNKAYVGVGAGPGVSEAFHEFDPNGGSDDKGVWNLVKEFNQRFDAVGFSIGNKGYLATGQPDISASLQKDLWEFDPIGGGGQGTWTKMADTGGIPRKNAIGFTIGNKGYIGLGNGFTQNPIDFWEYTPTLDQNEVLEIEDCN